MYNPTCIITGKKDNLQMKAHRNENGDMIGWIFIHESICDATEGLDIEWKFKIKDEYKVVATDFLNTKEQPNQ